LEFHHEILGEDGELRTLATVELVFVNTQTGKPSGVPDAVREAMEPHFVDR
jgi:acyl-CoA thioesterase FadM